MSINITPQIEAAYRAYLDEEVDCFVNGAPIRRRQTYPYVENEFSGLVPFAAGYQAAAGAATCVDTYAGCAPDCHAGNRCNAPGAETSQQPGLDGIEAVDAADNQWCGDMMILQALADSENVNDQERKVLTRWLDQSLPPSQRHAGVPGTPGTKENARG